MNLNKAHRRAFVYGVMQDVPKVDYSKEVSLMIQADNLKQLPPKLAEIYNDPELKSYLVTDICGGPSFQRDTLGNTRYGWVNFDSTAVTKHYIKSKKVEAQCEIIKAEAKAQQVWLDELEIKVTAAIAGCKTVKQALAALPEFAKYLPEEAVKTSMLPAIANLAADLAKAGWPKGKTPVAA